LDLGDAHYLKAKGALSQRGGSAHRKDSMGLSSGDGEVIPNGMKKNWNGHGYIVANGKSRVDNHLGL
jgi:hypothetical protein